MANDVTTQMFKYSSKLIGLLVVILVILFPVRNTSGQTKQKKAANKKTALEISEPAKFFPEFTANKESPERGEFETLDEYQKRLSKSFDSTKLIYLKLSESPSYKSYKYDIENQRLYIFGGSPKEPESIFSTPKDTTSIIIEISIEDKGKYKASNAFGATVTVEKKYLNYYIVNFINIPTIPDSVFDNELHCFKLSIFRPPKEAEDLSWRLKLVASIRPLGYQQSNLKCVASTKPTINKPDEIAAFHYTLDARLVKLYIYDEILDQILYEYDVP